MNLNEGHKKVLKTWKKIPKKELGITFRKHLIKKNPEKIGTDEKSAVGHDEEKLRW